MSEQPTRRGVLKSTAALATAGALGPVAIDGADARATEPTDHIPTTTEEIRAAFADVPYNEDPTDFDRRLARARCPDVVVPDRGPVPDPQDHVTIQLETPPWALATAYDKARAVQERGGEPDRRTVDDTLLDHWGAWEEWVLPDGSDAVDAILAAVEEDAP